MFGSDSTNRSFHTDILTCHSKRSTDVDKINDGSINGSASEPAGTLQGAWTWQVPGIQPSLIWSTLSPFLLRHVKMPAVKRSSGLLNMNFKLTSAKDPTPAVSNDHRLIQRVKIINRKDKQSNIGLPEWCHFSLLQWFCKIINTEISEASGVSNSCVLGSNWQVRNKPVFDATCFKHRFRFKNPLKHFPHITFPLPQSFSLFDTPSPSTHTRMHTTTHKPSPCLLAPSQNQKV